MNFAKSLRLILPMKDVLNARTELSEQASDSGESVARSPMTSRSNVSRRVTSVMKEGLNSICGESVLDKPLSVNRFRLTQFAKKPRIRSVRSAVSFKDELPLSKRVSRFRVVSLHRVPKRDSLISGPVPNVLP